MRRDKKEDSLLWQSTELNPRRKLERRCTNSRRESSRAANRDRRYAIQNRPSLLASPRPERKVAKCPPGKTEHENTTSRNSSACPRQKLGWISKAKTELAISQLLCVGVNGFRAQRQVGLTVLVHNLIIIHRAIPPPKNSADATLTTEKITT